ncbi:MAG: tetratricopeptide repeat protein [Candidatus Methanoperedens sp.]
MPRKAPDSIKNMINLKDMRAQGIELAAKKVFEEEYEDAKLLFAQVLEISPNDAHVLCLLANVFILEENFKKAQEWLDKALRINPDYPWASYHMGVVYHELGEFEKSIEMYEKALDLFSKDDKDEIADTYQNLGCSLWEVKRRQDAIEAWKTCLKFNPGQRYAKENLKDYSNEYGMPSVPMFDDYYAFTDIKHKEYLISKGKEDFDDLKEENVVLRMSMDAWNDKILPKWGVKLYRMKTKDKVKLFNDTKVFE